MNHVNGVSSQIQYHNLILINIVECEICNYYRGTVVYINTDTVATIKVEMVSFDSSFYLSRYVCFGICLIKKKKNKKFIIESCKKLKKLTLLMQNFKKQQHNHVQKLGTLI